MPRRQFVQIAVLSFAVAVAVILIATRVARVWPAREDARTAALIRPAPPEPEESFRLAPDRRVLIAVGDLHHLATGAPRRDAEARFDGSRWHVEHDGVEVGALPEYPDYPDLVALLQGWALALQLDRVVDAPGMTGDPGPIEDALARLDALDAASLAERRWSVGERGRGLFGLAARALVQLELETPDRVGVADRLAARALALLAADQALEPGALERESCLLASRLGYGAWARNAAGHLPAFDPVRAYVRGSDRRLASLAEQRHAPAETRFLRLLRIDGQNQPQAWADAATRCLVGDDGPAYAVTATAFSDGAVDATPTSALAVAAAIERDLARLGAAGAPDTVASTDRTVASVAASFERRLDAAGLEEEGTFLDRDVLLAHWRAGFYSTLRAAVEREPDARSAAGGRPRSATPPPAVAAEFGAWASHLAAARRGALPRANLIADLGAMPHFGVPLLTGLYEALCDLSPAADLAPRRGAELLAARCDTRPAHRATFGWIARRRLLAFGLGDALLASAVRAGAPMDWEVEAGWAALNADRAALAAMLARPALGDEPRAVVIERDEAIAGADSATVNRAWRAAIAAHPDSWRLVAGLAASLERQGGYVDARTVIHRWLDRNVDRAGLESIAARATLARLYEDQHRDAEGFAAVASVVASQQPAAMAVAARLLEALGRTSQAETLAVFAAECAPRDPGAPALAAELLWRHGKPGVAARVLAARAGVARPATWIALVAPRFVACFRRHPAAGIAAAESLVGAHAVPGALLDGIIAAAADSGAWEMGFGIASRVRDPARWLERLALAYGCLARWKGGAAASAWLAPRLDRVGDRDRAWLGAIAFERREDELLWDAAPDSAGPSADHHWLLRAAAAVRAGGPGGPHTRSLAWHFAAPGGGCERLLGRCFLGLEDAAQAEAAATGPRERCEAFYFLGLKAELEGRVREAADAYARALGTHAEDCPEFGWSYARLAEWGRLERSLDRMASAPARTPA